MIEYMKKKKREIRAQQYGEQSFQTVKEIADQGPSRAFEYYQSRDLSAPEWRCVQLVDRCREYLKRAGHAGPWWRDESTGVLYVVGIDIMNVYVEAVA